MVAITTPGRFPPSLGSTFFRPPIPRFTRYALLINLAALRAARAATQPCASRSFARETRSGRWPGPRSHFLHSRAKPRHNEATAGHCVSTCVRVSPCPGHGVSTWRACLRAAPASVQTAIGVDVKAIGGVTLTWGRLPHTPPPDPAGTCLFGTQGPPCCPQRQVAAHQPHPLIGIRQERDQLHHARLRSRSNAGNTQTCQKTSLATKPIK